MVSTSATHHSTASAEGSPLGHTLQVLASPLVHNGSLVPADGEESGAVSHYQSGAELFLDRKQLSRIVNPVYLRHTVVPVILPA